MPRKKSKIIESETENKTEEGVSSIASIYDLYPEFKELGDAEVERLSKLVRIRKDLLAIRKEELLHQERTRNLCTIDSAMSQFAAFLAPVRNFLAQLADHVQDIVPTLTPDEYRAIQRMVAEQTDLLAKRELVLSIESTRDRAEAETEHIKQSRRHAHRLAGERVHG